MEYLFNLFISMSDTTKDSVIGNSCYFASSRTLKFGIGNLYFSGVMNAMGHFLVDQITCFCFCMKIVWVLCCLHLHIVNLQGLSYHRSFLL
jgi:hypothetical protein